ncbi:MBL fold metallo-hydrolase [Embleya sp. NBC_00896]|uniref:MBL fold metallo-hydrolase n=1 Tax=Embleya sp. NBC_00896 TaxID=2975961 RepID=UPI002F919C6B|nr:MBL fold metallo-hydrolase [Embleya sp. NBC_00896]
MCENCTTSTRGSEAGASRRGVLRGAVLGGAGVAAGLTAASPAQAAEAVPIPEAETVEPARKSVGVGLRWLGVAGWEISFDGRVLYFDPYLSRFDYRLQGGALRTDPRVIEGLLASGRLAGPPELIMVSHGHWDHMADVPYLLGRKEWKQGTIDTIGTETHAHLLRAMGVERSVIVASGGEYLAFAGGAYTVEVIRSLHSQSGGHGFFAPGTRTAPPPPPATIDDLVEGGTLAYQVTVPGRLKVLMFGGTNFVERELAGLRPDVVVVSMTDFSTVHEYLPRLLTALGGPRYVIPSHHDDMITGYDDPNLPKTVRAQAVTDLRDAIRRAGLPSRVLPVAHLQRLDF